MSSLDQNSLHNEESKGAFSKLTFHKLNWLEWITIGLAVWFIIYPKPYTLLFSVLLAMPVIGIFLNGMSGRPSVASLVTITREDGKDKYDVADFIDVAAWAILFRVIKDFEFENFYSVVIPVGFTCVCMLAIVVTTHKIILESGKSKFWIYGSILFNILIYSFAGTYGANCVYDSSEPTVYEAEVVNKRMHKGRKGRVSYYVEVKAWGHHYDKEEIPVEHYQYDAIQPGSKVKIDLKKGLFSIPWYYIE